MDKQQTIGKEVSFQGIGLHTGIKVKVKLLPALPDSGIVFFREDKGVLIKADLYSVTFPGKFPRRTSIGSNNVYVQTVEHLMAALSLLGIDNLQVSLDGEEVPGMDGSAGEFVKAVRKAGIVKQDVLRKLLVVKEPVFVDSLKSSIVILPYSGFRISYTLDYENPAIPADFLDIDLSSDKDSVDNLSLARTFCLKEEVANLRSIGIGKGADYTNTLVVSEKGVIDNKLRDGKELIKHKILDLVGDLYLSGHIKGHVIAFKSGHRLNVELLQILKKYREKAVSSAVSAAGRELIEKEVLSAEDIMRILPHRYPFLLVDRVIHLEQGKKAVGIKNVTINDYFFQGHFPGKPVMPGVLLIEAMAQVGGVLMLSPVENRGKLAYFMAVDNVKFRRTVVPGDQVVMEVSLKRARSKAGEVEAKAFVNNKIAVEGNLKFILV